MSSLELQDRTRDLKHERVRKKITKDYFDIGEAKEKPVSNDLLLNITDEEITEITRALFKTGLSMPLRTLLLDRAINILFAMINNNMVTYKRPNTHFMGVEFLSPLREFTQLTAYGRAATLLTRHNIYTRESFIERTESIIHSLIVFDILKLLNRTPEDVFRIFFKNNADYSAEEFLKEIETTIEILNSYLLENSHIYAKYIVTMDDLKLSNRAKGKLLLDTMNLINESKDSERSLEQIIESSNIRPLPKQILKINVLDFKDDYLISNIYAVVKTVMKEITDTNAHYRIISDSLLDLDATTKKIISTLYTIVNKALKEHKE